MEDHNSRSNEYNNKRSFERKKVKFRFRLLDTRKENRHWIIVIIIATFIISATLSLVSSIMENANLIIALLITIFIIIVGILFDIIGTAVTAADEAPFHAMASRKFYGAKEAIFLIRNADKVSNFCNDVVGDICGVISGAGSAYIILKVAGSSSASNITLESLLVTGLIASATVGGKAMGKTIAIANSNYIIYKVGIIYKFLTHGRINTRNKKKNNRRKKVET